MLPESKRTPRQSRRWQEATIADGLAAFTEGLALPSALDAEGREAVMVIVRAAYRAGFRDHRATQAKNTPAGFWARVDKNGPEIIPDSPCWPWTGSRNPAGYGQLSWQGIHSLAPRVAYELTYGPLPPGEMARHECDNPPCVNPAHLIPGTHHDNMRDVIARARQRGERNNGARLTRVQAQEILDRALAGEDIDELASAFGVHRQSAYNILHSATWADLRREPGKVRPFQRNGERHGGAKLTEQQVRAIRRRREQGEGRRTLATEYGVSISAIKAIAGRKTWAYLSDE